MIKKLAWDVHFHAGKRIDGNRTLIANSYPDHAHAFVEATVLVAGTAWHRTALGERCIGAGDAFLMRPGAWHGFERSSGLKGFNCCFDPSLLGRELAWMADHAVLRRLLWTDALASERQGVVELHLPPAELAACRRELVELAGLPADDYEQHHAEHLALLIRVLGILARNLPPVAVVAKRQPLTHPIVVSTLALLENDPASPWTLTGLAARAHVTPTYLVRLFRSATGLPPIAYLNRRRNERAAALLVHGDAPIGAIGAQVGWPDANYFSRIFRRQFALTPTVYRQRFTDRAG